MHGGFPEGQQSHSTASQGLASISLIATLAATFRKRQTRELIGPRVQAIADGSDQMFG